MRVTSGALTLLAVLLTGGAVASFVADPLVGSVESRTEGRQPTAPPPTAGEEHFPKPIILEKVALQEIPRLRMEHAVLDFKHWGSFRGYGGLDGALPPGDVVVVVPDCAAVREALEGKTPLGTLYRADVQELEFSVGLYWPHQPPQPCPALFQGIPGAQQDDHSFRESTALVVVAL